MVKKRNFINYCGLGSVVGLMVVGILMCAPQISPTANAEVAPLTQSARMKAETYVYSSLALALSDNVSLDITPTSGGVFTTGEATLSITTNNTTGYSIYMSTGDNTSSLLPANGLVDASIDPVDGSMNSTNYTNHLNEWGYALGEATADTSYAAIPKANSAPIITSEEMAADEQYKLNFGVAVGPTLPAGTYYNSVLVSAVANPIAVHTLSGITYMQEMSPYVCDYSDVGETKQLIDTRDQNSYWVAKLADNKCWMTQNLALNLSPNDTYTSTDTDLPKGVNYTPTSGTNAVGVSLDNPTDTLATREYSWDMGKFVIGTPLRSTFCTKYGAEGYSAVSGDNVGENCANVGVIDVSGEDWEPSFSATMGDYVYDAESNKATLTPNESGGTFIAADTVNKTYDAHYVAGNYYQFNAATAGVVKNTTVENTNSSGSICPRGWRLPSGEKYSDQSIPLSSNEFYQLLLGLGYAETDATTVKIVGPGTNSSMNPAAPPLHFAHSGWLHPNKGVLRDAGYSTHIWSGTVRSGTNGYAVNMNLTTIDPEHSDVRYVGLSVRCVAR